MIRIIPFVTILLLSSSTCMAQQIGGSYVYTFLNIPASARVAAMGGTFLSVKDNDINGALQNTSLLNPWMNNQLALNGVVYFDGVKFGDAAYVRDFHQHGTFMANMHFADYGQFLETDNVGQVIGTFRASDYNLNLGWGYQLNKIFSIGACLKSVYSNYYYEHAFGIGADVSGTMVDSASQITVALVARNVGVMINSFTPGDQEPFPSEVDAAISKRLLHTPFRFNLTYRHAERFDLTYRDPNDVSQVDPLTGTSEMKTYDFFDKLSSHLIFATELILTKNVHLRAAYNFQRRQEMRIDSSPGTVGISWGFGIKVSKFIISYGNGAYHAGGSANHFSISTNLSDFTKSGN